MYKRFYRHALLDFDYVRKQAWEAGIGLVTDMSLLLEADSDWWLADDGPNQLADIKPGIGFEITNNGQSYSQNGFPFLTPRAYNRVWQDGICVCGRVTGSSTGALTGSNGYGVYIVVAKNPGYNPLVEAGATVTASSIAYTGINWADYSDNTPFDGDEIRFAFQYTDSNKTWLGAVNGVAVDSVVGDPGLDLSLSNKVAVGLAAGAIGNVVTANLKRAAFFQPNKTQQQLIRWSRAARF